MRLISVLLAVLLMAAATVPATAQTAQCGLSAPVFCDTFNAPAGTGNRSGQLNGTVWGVSRTTGNVNPDQGILNGWGVTSMVGCNGTMNGVQPPGDVIVCNGHVREAMNDLETVAVLAMYPKQPFDFAGRTGKVTFDVSNDSSGSHGAWPELWITDTPDPAPFTHQQSWTAFPKNALGLRFSGFVNSSGAAQSCPQGSPAYLGVDSAVTVNNYVPNDTTTGGNLSLHGFDCVKAATAVGQMNHYEIDVSTSLVDIYGTDAGTTSPLKHLAQITNPNLSFTRGLVWIEDVHYNGNKFGTQGTHTFAWDNVGFDGPLTYHDLSFDAPDALPGGTNSDGSVNLGKVSQANQTATWSVPGLPANPSAALVRVMWNLNVFNPPTAINLTVNGHPHSVPWPYPDSAYVTWRTIDTVIPISELVAGTNTVALGASQRMVTSNVNIVLVNVGGSPAPTATPAPATATATPVPPTATALPTATATVVPTSTTVPTATVVPTDTPQPVATDTPVATVEPTMTAEPIPTDQATPCPTEQVTVNVAVTVGTQQRTLTFCQ